MKFSLSLETPSWNWNLSPSLAMTEHQVFSFRSYQQFQTLHDPLWALHRLLTNLETKHNLQAAQCIFLQLPLFLSTNLSRFFHKTLNLETSYNNLLPHQDETSDHSSYTLDTSGVNPKLIQWHIIGHISVKNSFPGYEQSRDLDSIAAYVMNWNLSFHPGKNYIGIAHNKSLP